MQVHAEPAAPAPDFAASKTTLYDVPVLPLTANLHGDARAGAEWLCLSPLEQLYGILRASPECSEGCHEVKFPVVGVRFIGEECSVHEREVAFAAESHVWSVPHMQCDLQQEQGRSKLVPIQLQKCKRAHSALSSVNSTRPDSSS